jgi:hypothetical protein
VDLVLRLARKWAPKRFPAEGFEQLPNLGLLVSTGPSNAVADVAAAHAWHRRVRHRVSSPPDRGARLGVAPCCRPRDGGRGARFLAVDWRCVRVNWSLRSGG